MSPVDPPRPDPHAGPAAVRRRVLVVDDNEDSAESLAVLLRVSGHEAHVARDGEEAVEAAQRLRPGVILLDIGMPRLDGYEACQRIRSLPGGNEIAIVALTGRGQSEDRQRSTDAGFDGHLVKPVDRSALDELLRTARRAPA